MLVAKEHKKILLNLNDPGQIMALIPGAKTMQIKGHDIVSVPHDMDTVRVLRNLGMKAPGPILSYYNWQGRYKPFIHQYETSEFLTSNPRAFCLNGMGSGKTLAVLWAFDYLRKIGEVDWLLVISPLSTLERTWADEIFRHFPDMSCGVVHGTPDKRLRVLADKYDAYVINHDGIKSKQTLDAIRAKPGRGLIVIDELAAFRNASTDRWKAMNLLVNGDKKKQETPRKWVWGLTGTPIPNEPTDAWAQCRLITPSSVPSYYGSFRDNVMRQLTQYKWVARSDSLPIVHRVMQPSIRFATADCIDLPPTTFLDREVELTREQALMYKDMLAKFKAEYAGGQVTALNEAVKIGKLLQIVCGVAYSADGNITIPAKPRTDVVLETIEEAGSKVIVFVPLTGALEALAEAIRKHYTCEIVHGATSKSKRDQIFHDFMQPNGPHVIVAQPGTMSHGLTLTSADTIIWYAPIHSAETYQQANARIVRPGQTRNTRIVRVQGSKLERDMYAKLEKRETTQGVLLDLFD